MNRTSRIAQLRQMLLDDPDDLFVKYALALEHSQSDDTTEAVRLLEEIRSTNPSYTAVYYQLALLYHSLDRMDEARLAVEEGMKRTRPHDMKTHNELRGLMEDWDDLI